MAQLSARTSQDRLESDRLLFLQDDACVRNFADTDSRPLKILNDRHGSATLVRGFANGLDGRGMRGMSAVGKVQPGGIHALFDQPV